MPKWTSEQLDAINARNKTILVSAAAGSGKTAVLVERVIRRILDDENPCDVDNLLIVTFTNAAAAEMRERISKAIDEKVAIEPFNTHLKRQQILLPSAKICTIDSFCMDLVKEYSYMLNIESNYKIIDNADENNLQTLALNSVLENMYNQPTKEFAELVELMSNSKNDEMLCQTIKTLHSYSMANWNPSKWLASLVDSYDLNFENSLWFKSLLSFSSELVSYAIVCENTALTAVSQSEKLFSKMNDMLNCEKNYLLKLQGELTGNGDLNKIIEILTSIEFPRMATDRNAPQAQESCKLARDTVKKIVAKLLNLFCTNTDETLYDLTISRSIIEVLSQCTLNFSQELLALKKEKNAFSFADIEQFAIKLLIDENKMPTPLAVEMQNKFTEILIDEYQDTNDAQDILFSSISRGDNLFMVGDVKQSIYRFRLAMPQIFNEKRKAYRDYENDDNNSPSKIVLSQNFRSRKGVCDYINFLFENVMSESVGELVYGKNDYLNAGLPHPEIDLNPVEFHSIISADKKNSDENEANYLADLIINKVNTKELICDKSLEKRPVEYGDFAILLRSANEHIPNYVKVFKERGIPVISQSSSSISNNPEIVTIVSLLKVLDNPMLDIPLLTVMLSPIFGFTENEIAKMRINDRYSSLFVCVKNYSKNDEKTTKFLERLEELRTYCGTMSVSSLVRKIIDETSYISIVKSMDSTGQKDANIYLFMEFADNYQSVNEKDLTSFIRMIDKGGFNAENAKIVESGLNAVKIMSVHRSKGLEFPICILAGTSRKYSNTSASSNCLLHPNFGVAIKCRNSQLDFNYPSLLYNAVKSANDRAEMSENLRVLYVAFTRAREQLIILSTDNKNKLENTVQATEKVPSYIVANMQSDSAIVWEIAKVLENFYQCDENGNYFKDEKIVPFLIKTVNDEDIFSLSDCKTDEIIEACSPNLELVNKINEIINYKYPFSQLSTLAAKRNASSLDEKENDFTFFACSRPAFLDEDGLTSAQKGTAMHNFMQHCSYENARDNIKNEAVRMLKSGFLTDVEFESLSYDKLQTFFTSDLGKRMFNSKKIYREIKFSTFVSSQEIYNVDFDEKIFVQGIADCAFEENGQLIVVDYKTDKIKNEVGLLKRYEKQISFYGKALEKTIGLPVKSLILYSFYLDKPISY